MAEDVLDSAREQSKITAIKSLQVQGLRGSYVRVETDSGVAGHGPCGTDGPFARGVIESLEGGRLPHLGLIGKDPLAIKVHHHNMFYAYEQRTRHMKVLSAIDMALWDLAGKLLNQPVSVLLGGPFRAKIPLYSHTGNGLDRSEWMDRAQRLKEDPRGFKAYKVDIHHALGGSMQEYTPMIGPREERKVRRAYELAREALGDDIDIIVHCHNELDVPSAIRVAQAVEPIKPLFYEDPIAPGFGEGWMALRRATRLTIMTGENIELVEGALPFLESQAVDVLQPDLINSGGITGVKAIAETAAAYRTPICLHNVTGFGLDMASQQWSASVFNCPMMECRGNADQPPEAAGNAPVIEDGCVEVSTRPGLGLELNHEYMKEMRVEGEPWWED